MGDSKEEKRDASGEKNGQVISNGCRYSRENHKALAADGAQQEGLAWECT